jgi:hypothetical protein
MRRLSRAELVQLYRNRMLNAAAGVNVNGAQPRWRALRAQIRRKSLINARKCS